MNGTGTNPSGAVDEGPGPDQGAAGESEFRGCPMGRRFDHHSTAFREAAPDIYAEMHSKCPVIHSDSYGGFTYFTRHADVVTILRDHETFSSVNELDPGKGRQGDFIPASAVRIGFMETDPPEHSQYRKVFTNWFAPSKVAAYEDRLREIAIGRIERAAGMGEFDAIEDLANPITAEVTMDFMGMPLDRLDDFLGPLHKIAYMTTSSPDFGELMVEIEAVRGEIREFVLSRRAEPQDDFASKLIATEINGATPPDDTIVEIIWSILAGGFDTSSSVMAYLMHYLTEHPDARRMLSEQPDLLPAALEEFVRHGSPQTNAARTVTRPTTVGETKLEPGDRVMVGLGAANFDPTRFEQPHEIKLDREKNFHLSFSDGIHRCPGSRFARVELRVFAEELLRRMPRFEVHSERILELPSAGNATGYISVPATAVGSPAGVV